MSSMLLWLGSALAAPGAHLQIALGHSDAVVVGAFSPDGARLATGSDDQTAGLWDAHTGALLHTLAGHADRVADLAWAPDGARVATASWDGTGAVWDRVSGRLVVRLEGHTESLNAVRWSPDGERLLTMSDDGTAIVWDGATGRRVQTLAGHAAHLTACAWSPDGARILTASADGRVLVWENGAVDVRIEGIGPVYAAVFSPDGRSIATASRDGVGLWSAGDGTRFGTLDGHFEPVFALAYSPDGKRLATGSWDETLRIWDPASESAVVVIDHSAAVDGLAWSPDGASVLAATRDGRATVWDAATGERGAQGPPEGVDDDTSWPVGWSPDGRYALSGRAAPTVWDAATGAVAHTFTGRVAPLLDVAWAEDVLLSVAAGGAATWDLDRGRVAQVAMPESAFTAAALAPDGARFAAAEASGAAGVWDARTGRLAVRLAAHSLKVHDASFSPDGTRLLTASLDHQAIVWDLAQGSVLARILTGQESADTARWSSDGARVVTTSLGRTSVWDAGTGAPVDALSKKVRWSDVPASFSPTGSVVGAWKRHGLAVWSPGGKRVAELEGHSDRVTDVAWSPDGRRLATASNDGTAAVWDPLTGERLAVLPADDAVTDVAISADGARILTASADNTAALWDASGAPVHRLEGHLGPVRVARFSAGDRYVYTASADGTVRLWDAQSGALVATLVVFPDGRWAVVDPHGRFDGSDDGDVPGLYWVIGGEAYDLGQLRAHFYDPGLLAKLVGGRDESLRDVPSLLAVAPPPVASVSAPTPDGVLELRVTDRGGGIGPTEVWLNGVDISDAVRAACPSLAAPCRVDLSERPTWVLGATNRVEVRTSDLRGTVRSRGIDVAVPAAGAPVTDPPDLWVLAVGTSDYAGERLDLRYAGLDANRFGEAMTIAGARGFGANHTHIRVLSTDPGVGVTAKPTRAAVEDAFRWLRGADPHDTVVVFFAGHGKAHADAVSDDYYYVLADAGSFADLVDPGLRARRAWSGKDLADGLALVPALKRVVILDTCEAGKAGALSLAATRDVSSDAVRAHARARERTGAWFLAGAAADQPSYEATRFGQGLLTYTLLEAMQGPGLDGASQLLVSRLFGYAEDHVPEYARGIGGVQQPYVRAGEGDFPLGEIPLDVRARIPIGRERAAMVRALVVGEGGAPDRLAVGAAIDLRLRAAGEGADARFAWLDADTFAGAWQVTGQVRTDAAGVTFTGFLSRVLGDGEIRVELAAVGPDAAAVATAVAEQVSGHLR